MKLKPFVQTGGITSFKTILPGRSLIIVDQAGAHTVFTVNGLHLVEDKSDVASQGRSDPTASTTLAL
jgi:hypothetical protein